MKKTSILFFLLFLVLVGKAQNLSNNQGISLAADARKLIMPDLAILFINLSAEGKTEAESMDRLAKRQQEIMRTLKSEGFAEEQIRLSNFTVNAKYDYSKENAKRIGFIAQQSYTLRFALDKQRLLKVYRNLASQNNSSDLQVSMGTECSEGLREKTELELIKMAMRNASVRAAVLAEASGLKLGNIEAIRYHLTENQFPAPMMMAAPRMAEDAMKMGAGENFSQDFSLQEIESSERVEVHYQLLNK